MQAEQSEAVETALWVALRSLEENIALNRRMALRARERNNMITATQFEENVRDAEQHAETIRQVLLKKEKPKSQQKQTE